MTAKKVFKKIKNLIVRKKSLDKPYLIGINGIDASGKTEFSKNLNNYLIKKGFKTQIIHLDDFHNSRKIRYQGENQSQNYFFKSFNYKLLKKEILEEIQSGKKINKKINLLNLKNDKFNNLKNYKILKNSIVILEGVFLFQKDLIKYFDYKIFLKIDFNKMLTRGIKRDKNLAQNIKEKYQTKYLPAQKTYLKKFKPHKIADLIVNNNDFIKPKIIKI